MEPRSPDLTQATAIDVPSESSIKHIIRTKLSENPSIRLFNNSVGVVKDRQGNVFQFGLAPGSSDLIGWCSRVVTTADIGKKIAQFLAIEVKSPTGKLSPIQRNFLVAVSCGGGLSGVARNTEQALEILRW